MKSNREDIDEALFTFLKTGLTPAPATPPLFQTMSRQPVDINQVAQAQQPSLYLYRLGEARMKSGYGLGKYLLHYTILCYFRADASLSKPREAIFNPALDAIDALFVDPTGQPITLGGLIDDVWIEGDSLLEGGIIDPQIGISIPLRVSLGN